MFESVVLPAPFSPRSACTSPSTASKLTSSFATTPGKRFDIPTMRTAGGREAPTEPAPLTSRALPGSPPTRLARRLGCRDLPDHPLREPLHRVQVRKDLERLTFRYDQLARLVVQRPGEDVELARDDRLL